MFVRLYSGDGGQTHFEELGPPVGQSPVQAATSITFLRSEPGDFVDWHTAHHDASMLSPSPVKWR